MNREELLDALVHRPTRPVESDAADNEPKCDTESKTQLLRPILITTRFQAGHAQPVTPERCAILPPIATRILAFTDTDWCGSVKLRSDAQSQANKEEF